jgi:hypothetical protein
VLSGLEGWLDADATLAQMGSKDPLARKYAIHGVRDTTA